MIRFCSPREFDEGQGFNVRVYRVSWVSSLVMLTVFAGILGGGLFLMFQIFMQSSSWARFLILGVIGCVCLLMALVVWAMAYDFRRSLSSENWFVRTDGLKVHIMLRYFFNRELDDEELALELDPSDIESARYVRERITVDTPSARRSTTQHQDFIDLTLRPQDFLMLTDTLRKERELILGNRAHRGWRSKFLPVQFNAKTRVLRLNWQRVKPNAKQLCSDLQAMNVLVEETLNLNQTMNLSASDDDILKLIETGRSMEAITLLRFQKDFSLKEAKDFVEELGKTGAGREA